MYASMRATRAHTPHVTRCTRSNSKPSNPGLKATVQPTARRLCNHRRRANQFTPSASKDDADGVINVEKAPDGDANPTDKPPKWMEILEESAEWDPDIAKLLDGAGKDPNEIENRIRDRFEKRKETIYKEREGSTVPMLVKFNEFTSHNLWIWVESHNKIAVQEEPLIDEVFKAWFVLGKLGGFNSENQQVQQNFFEVSNMQYDMELANGESDVPQCVFHSMGGPEYKGKWARAHFDLGSADELCIDILINAFIQFSREYFGIKTLVIGGENVNKEWPASESEFYIDESGEMDPMVDTLGGGAFERPPPGTTVSGGMSPGSSR